MSIDKSISPSTSQYDSTRTADADGQRFLPDASAHRTSGSSRESGLAIGTNDGCIVSASPMVVPESHTPSPVATQTREGVERDEGDAPTNARPQRRAVRQQRALLSRLIEMTCSESCLPSEIVRGVYVCLALRGGFLLKTVNSENSSEMLLFFYIFTSDPVMNRATI